MLKPEGTHLKRTRWTLFIPEEHCKPGLEVMVISEEDGLYIAGNKVSWGELESARKESQKDMPF